MRIHRLAGEKHDVRWPPNVGDRVDLPPDCSAGDLAEVLEFLKVSPSPSPCKTRSFLWEPKVASGKPALCCLLIAVARPASIGLVSVWALGT